MTRHATLHDPRRLRAALEIGAVFLAAAGIIAVGWSVAGPNPLARQAVVWVANVAMLAVIWAGLGLRNEGWAALGLPLRRPASRAVLLGVPQSLAVLVVALAGFLLGSVVGAPIVGVPEPAADLSGYNYLQGNLPLLLAGLCAVYVASSFGEEVVYRGFLITRLEEVGGGGRVAIVAAVTTSSVAFGLAHFDWGAIGVIQTGFMGLALAGAYLVLKRNLWALVLAHAYLDTMLLVQQYLGPANGGA